MRLVLENFLCHENMTFDLGENGLSLISGRSGRGKTSILKAIFFALFGEGTKLQTYGKKSTKVELEFDDLKIVRTKRPNRLIIWPSSFMYPHCVTPIEKGIRYSIVAWAL